MDPLGLTNQDNYYNVMGGEVRDDTSALRLFLCSLFFSHIIRRTTPCLANIIYVSASNTLIRFATLLGLRAR
jgi:hypothetical protein